MYALKRIGVGQVCDEKISFFIVSAKKTVDIP
jgi:hypothetical protein